MIRIGPNDFGRLYGGKPKADLIAAFAHFIDEGSFVLGNAVERFETSIASQLGIPSVGVGSGLDAIEIALRASGLVSGAGVLLPAISAFASTIAVVRAGGIPIYYDVDGLTGQGSASSLVEAITKIPKVCNGQTDVTHCLAIPLFGFDGEYEAISAICQENNLVLICDNAQSLFGTTCSSAEYADLCDVMATSFYPTKNLGGFGEGGAIFSGRPDVIEFAKRFRNYGSLQAGIHESFGINSRLDALQACLLSLNLERLPKLIARRKEIGRYYREQLQSNELLRFTSPDTEGHTYHQFVVTSEIRDQLKAHLSKRQIATGIHYPLPMPYQKACKEFRHYSPVALDGAMYFSERCLSLPCSPELCDDDLKYVTEILNEIRHCI